MVRVSEVVTQGFLLQTGNSNFCLCNSIRLWLDPATSRSRQTHDHMADLCPKHLIPLPQSIFAVYLKNSLDATLRRDFAQKRVGRQVRKNKCVESQLSQDRSNEKKHLSSESHYIAITLHSQHELHNDMFEETLVFCKMVLNHSE